MRNLRGQLLKLRQGEPRLLHVFAAFVFVGCFAELIAFEEAELGDHLI